MRVPSQTLDVRLIQPREKHPSIFRLFDALQPGQCFQLINDHDPMPLFYQMQAERPGLFDWTKAENGPEVWRVNITRI